MLASRAACVVSAARRATCPFLTWSGHPPLRAGRDSRHDEIPVDKTYRDRCRRRAGAGDRGHGSLAATNRVAAAPSNTGPPVVSGTPAIGKELTTTNGTWSGTTPLSFSYQWRRCDKTGGSCANISNATDNTYKPQGADGSHTLRAVVTAKNSDGSDNATSVPTAVVPATPVSNNGCPADKSLKTAPIAQLAPPARLQIVAFDVLSGPINKQTNSFTMKVRVGSTCSVNIKGASVYVTAVPYNQFSIPDRRAHRGRRHHDPRLPPRRELPRQQQTATAHPLHPRDQAGRRPPRRRLDTDASSPSTSPAKGLGCAPHPSGEGRPAPRRASPVSLHPDTVGAVAPRWGTLLVGTKELSSFISSP